jgi:hypothetical protein
MYTRELRRKVGLQRGGSYVRGHPQDQETTGQVIISRRELAELVGKTFGGNQSEQLFNALQQLRYTHIISPFLSKQKIDGKWSKVPVEVTPDGISILTKMAYEGSKRGQFARCFIEVHDVVVENFRNRYISYFNWERMRGLDMVGMMLYKRFFRHMANIYRDGMDKERLVFEKDYEHVCRQWLGLKPVKQRSRIHDQLGKRLEALKACRLLREYSLEERARGKGFKIVALPGSGFWSDYENIYRRRLPSPPAVPVEPEPLVYLHEFHKQLGHDRQEFTPKEVEFVRDLLGRYGDDGVRDLMAFGLAKAREPKSEFDMQVFGALSVYEGEWKGQREKQAKVRERQAAIASCAVCNKVGMLEYEDGSVGRCPHELSAIAHIHSQKPIRGFPEA